jgi:Ca2+-binding EF-hand superfamily protein
MKTIILLSAAAAALAAAPSLAQQGRGVERSAGVTRAQVETRVRDMFVRVDANRDGSVTQAEAQAFRGAARAEPQNNRGERRESRFARLDANRDGSISRDEFFARARRGDRAEQGELRGVRAERRAERRAARLERRGQRGGMMARLGGKGFERIDANRDGRVTLAEATTQRLRAFDRADANRDGRLTREERQAVRAERQARRG